MPQAGLPHGHGRQLREGARSRRAHRRERSVDKRRADNQEPQREGGPCKLDHLRGCPQAAAITARDRIAAPAGHPCPIVAEAMARCLSVPMTNAIPGSIATGSDPRMLRRGQRRMARAAGRGQRHSGNCTRTAATRAHHHRRPRAAAATLGLRSGRRGRSPGPPPLRRSV